ncbi:hypothetical protein [Legionella londiniensis]|uniref:Alpha-2-macroglobulin domain-containing protein n=1 Tax=Legionella londiniensis TaxID=45068 RepID=A0A0W0VNM3_9GAMM|nr:hypothetical protein [Legionella londiniensis]KTD21687.1 hypothetical protein Llon_0852 [Legionella londiniensis]STX93478.1 Uncharacterised protein [Legionella londiniensis]
MKHNYCRWLLLGILFLSSSTVFSELDNVQALLLKAYQTPLRWDNIESTPYWISGEKPVYSLQLNQHIIRLKPGQFVKVLVPEGSVLRIMSRCPFLDKKELEVSASNGTGLYAEVPMLLSEDAHSFLTPRNEQHPRLFLISRPKNSKGMREISLFNSRLDYLPELAPYREIIPFCTKPAEMGREIDGSIEPYWEFLPSQIHAVTVYGPTRLAFENRIVYPETEAQPLQTYQVNSRLDGKPYRSLQFETSQELRWPVKINGKISVAGRQEVGYLEIPKGKHRLQLQASAKLYGRLLKQQSSDYLFPNFNAPIVRAETVEKLLPLKWPDFWSMDKKNIIRIIHDPHALPEEKEYIAKRVMRDNTRKDGGLLGVMFMELLAGRHLEYPLIKTVAQEFFGFHTFYRDIMPADKNTHDPQYMAWFLTPVLHNPGEEGQRLLSGEQFLQALLGRIASGYFNRLPKEGYEYILPPRASPTYLRVIIDSRQTPPGARFFLKIENEAPIAFKVLCNPELQPAAYQHTEQQMGLEVLAKLTKEPIKGTLSALFSQHHTPAEMTRAGVYELPLSKETRKIKVWPANPSLPVYVALQYRESDQFSLSETAYINTIQQLKPDTPIFSLLQKTLNIPYTHHLNNSQKELENHWLPLIRFIISRYAEFSASVADAPTPKRVKESETHVKLQQKMKLAEVLASDSQWLPALEIWSDIAQTASSKLQEKAQIKEIEALFKLGEYYLAEMKLRGYLLYGKNPSIRTWAKERLRSYFVKTHDIESLSDLFSVLLVIEPTPSHAIELMSWLLKNNEPKLALMLGLTIPDKQKPINLILYAAYQSQWWKIYNHFSNQVRTPEERHFWKALGLLEKRKIKEALGLLEHAGVRGQKWKNHLVKACQILQKINSEQLAEREEALSQWEIWQREQPGPSAWKDDAAAVVDYAKMVTLYSIPRDLYSAAFAGNRAHPVRLKVAGPIKLRLEIRPLHHKTSKEPIDGWIMVREKQILQLFPINGNVVSEAVKLFGNTDMQPGRRIFVELEVKPGIHEFRIDAQKTPFLTRIQTYQPQIVNPILPVLNPAIVTAALQGTLLRSPHASIPCYFYDCMTVIEQKTNCLLKKKSVRNLSKQLCIH